LCAPPGKRPRPRRAAGGGPAYPGCASSAVSRRWRRERGPASGWPAHTQKAAPSQGLRRASTHLGRGQPLQHVSSQRAHDSTAGWERGCEGGRQLAQRGGRRAGRLTGEHHQEAGKLAHKRQQNRRSVHPATRGTCTGPPQSGLATSALRPTHPQAGAQTEALGTRE
jgi:hypothetical protein